MKNPFKELLKRIQRSGKVNADAETAAAIAAALSLYGEGGVHDYESYIITIKRK